MELNFYIVVATILLGLFGQVENFESFKYLSPEKRAWLKKIAVQQGIHPPGNIKGARAKRQTCSGGGGAGGGGPPPVVNCPHAGTPANGAVSSGSNSHPVNAVVTYSCNVGYRLVGNRDNVCQAIGQWRNAAPTCVAVTCGFPGKPAHGAVSSGASSHAYNSRVTYSCDAGYSRVGPSDNLCKANGQWRNGPPTCKRITCSKPSLKPRVSVQPSRASYDYGTRVVFSCPVGYNRRGSSSSQCGGTGQWNQSSPTCQVKTCPSISAPAHGKVTTTSGNQYQSVATFSCNSGYHLSGSTRRTCQASAQWHGTQPTCSRVTCRTPTAPPNGNVNHPNNPGQNSVATYNCVPGYEIRGSNKRTCTYNGNSPTGVWSGTTPSCAPVSCGTPPTPAHGVRSGSTFTFGGTVTFRCEHGYYLQGDESITCQANKAWSISPPTRCFACAQNSYKSGTNAQRSCIPCPSNSHTTGQGSSTATQCICDRSYEGPNGGPCRVIKCPALTAPSHGVVGECSRNYNQKCSVHCVDGYVLHGGDETRTCLINKQWSGAPLTCQACSKNTYKSGSNQCSNCPLNSETSGVGSSLTDCTCKTGFRGPAGGPCEDIDECATNNGGCEQICTNLPGVHKCSCRDGFVKDETDSRKCIAKNACPDLDRPVNGGLVCLMRPQTNTERCSVKCNPGYEHIIRANMYEECGPSTNFLWTSPVLGCIEAFFGGLVIDGEAAYFTTSCDQITGDKLRQIQQAFLDVLRSRGICVNTNGQNPCNVEDVTVECGETDRTKRSTGRSVELKIKFKVKMEQISKLDTPCKQKCDRTSKIVLFDECYSACQAEVEKERRDTLKTVSSSVDRVLRPRTQVGARGSMGSIESMSNSGFYYTETNVWAPLEMDSLSIPGLQLTLSGTSQFGAIRSTCSSGMENRNNTCVPCPAGSYLSSSQSKCTMCPRDHYQPIARQSRCLPCEDGFHATPGATSCSPSATEGSVDFFVVIHPQKES